MRLGWTRQCWRKQGCGETELREKGWRKSAGESRAEENKEGGYGARGKTAGADKAGANKAGADKTRADKAGADESWGRQPSRQNRGGESQG